MKWVGVVLLLVSSVTVKAQTRDPRYFEIRRVRVTEIQDNAPERRQLFDYSIRSMNEGCEAKLKSRKPMAAINEEVNPFPGGQSGSQQPGQGSQQPGGPFQGSEDGGFGGGNGNGGGLGGGGGFPDYPDYGGYDPVLDRIINIGKAIWAVVDAGRPVVNFKSDVAHGLPAGIPCWSVLEGWKPPMIKAFRITYENMYGANVVEFEFRLSFIYGGSYKGRGHYITHAMFQPKKINVSWGFRFDAVATVPQVVNQGTRLAPIAALQMNMNWKVSSALKQMQQGEIFYINGSGVVQHVK